MIATVNAVPTIESPVKGYGVSAKDDETRANTKPVRIHTDVAELAEKLAPLFGESVPDFVSNRLRPVLEGLREEGAARLLQKPTSSRRKKE